MTRYAEVPATRDHVLELASTMRPAAVAEAWALAHYSPEEALLNSMDMTLDPMVGLADGKVMYMCGVAQPLLLSDWGMPWILTSHLVDENPRWFLRRSRVWIAEVRPRYSLLLTFVDARHTVAVHWLRWLGFEVLPPQPLGVDQLPFHLCKMED